jgi:hypothetical protein
MMLIISLLRYRATVHPLKPDVSRRKLKAICGLVYVVLSLIDIKNNQYDDLDLTCINIKQIY